MRVTSLHWRECCAKQKGIHLPGVCHPQPHHHPATSPARMSSCVAYMIISCKLLASIRLQSTSHAGRSVCLILFFSLTSIFLSDLSPYILCAFSHWQSEPKPQWTSTRLTSTLKEADPEDDIVEESAFGLPQILLMVSHRGSLSCCHVICTKFTQKSPH